MEYLLKSLGGCVIVKPMAEGSSNCTTKASTPADLSAALEEGLNEYEAMLVETFIVGREFTVAIIHGEVFPPMEHILPGGQDAYFARCLKPGGAREKEGSSRECPARLTEEEDRDCRALARQAVEALGVEEVARVDMRQGPGGEFYLLEVNTCPGMGLKSNLPYILQTTGVGFDAFTMGMLKSARVGKL